METLIEVTPYHIAEGRSGEYNACPIALALWEMGYRDINVDEEVVKLRHGRKELAFKPPKEMVLFIDAFDNYRPVKPQNFKLKEKYLPIIKPKTKLF